MTVKTLPALLYGLLLAPVAYADCPTRADLATGIRFEVATGEWEVFRQISDAIIQATYFYEPGEATQVLLGQGVYILQIIERENDALVPSSRQTFSYPLQPADMPDPSDGGGWNVDAAVLSDEGLSREIQIYEFGAPQQQVFGECAFQMIPITYRYRLADTDSFDTDTLHYLPELGISYLAASQGVDFNETYEYIAVQALK